MTIIRLRGRRTGQPRDVPVMFARDGSRLWVYCQYAERKSWRRNLREPAPVTVWLGGQAHPGVGHAIEGRVDPAAAAVGLGSVLRRFRRAARHVGIALRPTGEPDPAALRQLAARSVVVEIQLGQPA
jgi:hypothetical protein